MESTSVAHHNSMNQPLVLEDKKESEEEEKDKKSKPKMQYGSNTAIPDPYQVMHCKLAVKYCYDSSGLKAVYEFHDQYKRHYYGTHHPLTDHELYL